MGEASSKITGASAKYDIIVKTGDAYAGETDSDVTVTLVGEDGATTPWVKLDNLFVDDFERGQINHFSITTRDVGLPIILRIKLNHFALTDEWLCDNIKVKYNGRIAEFPIYDWVEDHLEVTTGKATLPQHNTNPYQISQRRQEVTRAQSVFAWWPRAGRGELGWGFPRFMNGESFEDLPKIFRQNRCKVKVREVARTAAKMNALRQMALSIISPVEKISDYHRLYKTLKRPTSEPVPKDWDTDECFGRAMLTGIAQIFFCRCTGAVPEGFDVINDDVSQFFCDGKTLEKEIEAGKIYITDGHKYLNGLRRNQTIDGKQIYCPDSFCMFYVREDKKFVPIAIQLVPGDRQYLFTPADSKEDWMLAKMYFRCTLTSVHQWTFHYLYTHGVMETIAVGVFRDLPRCHPIHKLLRPHLKNVVAINAEGRETLLPNHTHVNKAIGIPAVDLVMKVFSTFQFEDLHIPTVIENNGVGDPDLLPDYHYRDDALKLWKIMEKYVADVINHYYGTDQEVLDDSEIQHWAHDIATEGFGWQDSNTRGLPTSIETKKKLIEMCITIMFTSTAQHAAVNFGQFDTYKFAPMTPGGMSLPPHKKGEGSQQRIMDSLPDKKLSLIYIVFSFVLSQYSEDEVFIGNFPEKLFTEEAILQIQEDYKKRLQAYGDEVRERNAKLDHPYNYLLPERIPNYIAI